MAFVVVVSAYANSLVNFRGDLIRQMVAAGHQVVAAAPQAEARRDVEALGARFVVIPMQRAGMHPVRDAECLAALTRLLNREAPDVLLAYGVKPVLYCGLAHRMARCRGRACALINGLGYLFNGEATGWSRRALVRALQELYRVGISRYGTLIFQNPDDEADFRGRGYVRPTTATVIVNGSGVNTERFAASPVPTSRVRFLFIGRLLADKGIRELAEAVATLRKDFDFDCGVLGPFDENPTAVKREELDAWVERGVLEYFGSTDDVRPYIRECSCLVLPSYREGTPRSVLEAMAMGRAVVTTDAPGCRETVVPGETGLLVQPRSASDLARGMGALLAEPERLVTMGQAARRVACDKYAVQKVNAQMFDALGLSA